ncbi:MAG: CHAT domain-containing protein, partial [Acidobacteriota bacterium]
LSAAARAREAVDNDPSAARLHALGVAQLALGDLPHAVATLRLALARGAEPAIAADLARALLHSDERDGGPSRAIEALELLSTFVTAATAATADTADTAFTEAEALEALGLESEAIRAWTLGATLDPGSIRSSAALARTRALDAKQRGAVTTSAVLTEREVSETILGRWAGAVLARAPESEIEAALEEATRLAAPYAERHGNSLLVDTIAAAAAQTPQRDRLAHGELEYVEARRLYVAGSLAACVPKALAAVRDLAAGASPLSSLGELVAASCAFLRHDFVRADGWAAEASSQAERRAWPTVAGQAEWLRGLIAHAENRPDDSELHYEAALRAFASAHDPERQASVLALQADLDEYLGRFDAAWLSLSQGLQLAQLDRVRRYEMLASLSALAVRQGAPHVALRAAASAESEASATADRTHMADARMRLGQARERLGDGEGAIADYRSALTLAREIPDADSRRRSLAHVSVRLARLLAERDPAAARAVLAAAEGYSEGELSLRLAVVRADLDRRAGKLRAAELGLRHAIESSRAEEERLRTLKQRDDLVVERQELRWALVRLLADSGKADDALGIVESWRTANESTGSRAGVAARERETSPVVAYSFLSLPDSLFIWRRQGHETRFARRAVTQEALFRAVAQVNEELLGGGETAAAQLGALLFADLPPSPGARVVVAPDPILFAVPFAALPVEGRPLVETHELTLTRSLTSWMRSVVPTTTASTCALLIAGAETGGALYPELPALTEMPAELDAAASLYPCHERVSAASEVLRRLGPHFEVVHFAGHSVVGGDGSGFLLFGQGQDVHPVAREELATWRLSGATVVLSSCSAAEGRVSATAGRDGLAQTLLDAGAGAVIANVWPIDDQAAREFSTLLHAALAAGAAPPAAVRTAQREIIRRGRPLEEWAGWRVLVGS